MSKTTSQGNVAQALTLQGGGGSAGGCLTVPGSQLPADTAAALAWQLGSRHQVPAACNTLPQQVILLYRGCTGSFARTVHMGMGTCMHT